MGVAAPRSIHFGHAIIPSSCTPCIPSLLLPSRSFLIIFRAFK